MINELGWFGYGYGVFAELLLAGILLLGAGRKEIGFFFSFSSLNL